MCKYYKSDKKFKKPKLFKKKIKNYNVFCHINKKKNMIALTKKHNLGFLNQFYLPLIKESLGGKKIKNWYFHSNFKKSISNKKLNINLYYKFSYKIPPRHKWFSFNKNKEFIPSFTKKIFKQITKTS